MIKLKNLINENKFWVRKFGEPLPTIPDYAKRHQDKIKEGPEEKRKAKNELQRVTKAEAKLRERIYKLEQIFLDDPRPENQKIAKALIQSYKSNVTKFMRETLSLVKRVK